MDPPDPKRIVEQGYDRLGTGYTRWSEKATDHARERHTKLLLDKLPKRAEVLDFGCGNGRLLTRRLSPHFDVTGVELSHHMLKLARRNAPGVNLIRADMSSVEFPPGSFDGICAFYSLNHLPRDELPSLLGSVASWLKPNGLLVASMGSGENPGSVEKDWIGGVPMYFAGYTAEKNKEIVKETGLRLIDARLETIQEESSSPTFLWIVAEKPDSLSSPTT